MNRPTVTKGSPLRSRRASAAHDVVKAVTELPGADPVAVWCLVSTPAGINAELRPLLRMTAPRQMRADSLDEVDLGRCLGRAWVLFAGAVPVDFDDVCLVERESGRRFLERSATGAASVWQHERLVEPTAGGARVTDTVTYTVRRHLRPVRRAFRCVVAGIFRYRHGRLRSLFATDPTPTHQHE